MDNKVQLKHPRGGKPVRIAKEKYDVLKKAIVKVLRREGSVTHNELIAAVESDFKKTGTKFDGAVPWHVEWVKLDLEARKVIKRVAKTSPPRYAQIR